MPPAGSDSEGEDEEAVAGEGVVGLREAYGQLWRVIQLPAVRVVIVRFSGSTNARTSKHTIRLQGRRLPPDSHPLNWQQ